MELDLQEILEIRDMDSMLLTRHKNMSKGFVRSALPKIQEISLEFKGALSKQRENSQPINLEDSNLFVTLNGIFHRY